MSFLPAAAEPAIEVGAQAPAFEVADADGHMLELKALLERGPVLLAFYPKAQTSGCTQEMQAFVGQTAMLEKHHATVIAISRDDAKTLRAWRQKLGASFAFVPDTDGVLMKSYKAKMPVVTVAKRKTFVINQQGTIVYVAEGNDAIALKGVEDALKKI